MGNISEIQKWRIKALRENGQRSKKKTENECVFVDKKADIFKNERKKDVTLRNIIENGNDEFEFVSHSPKIKIRLENDNSPKKCDYITKNRHSFS